ncbi:MAG: ComEC/Rec2 family competence protein, partial [Pseudomonadota bacterium]
LYGQATRFFLWVPVWLGAGIAAYFALPQEPGAAHGVGAAATLLAAFALRRWGGDAGRVLAWVPILVLFGGALALGRAHLVAAPKLTFFYYGPVEGTVLVVDRSASDVPRVLLGAPYLARMDPARTPARVRVSLHSDHAGTALIPGARIAVTARLAPPGGPVEPGGFDFQRRAWFSSLGAVGYARAPPVLMAPPPKRAFRPWLDGLRQRIAMRLMAEMPGQKGAFAAAILVGDRSAIDPAPLAHLRASNLAHLLAISGLHMGLLTGFVFAVIRLGAAAVPPLALRLPAKKIAAAVALLVGLAYLGLSGANVATQRAFVMVAVMLLAVLFDRAAISLRAVTLAAIIILVLRPESLLSPGFQMSFAATGALVAVFETLNRDARWHALGRGPGRVAMPVLSLVMASAVAGAATAPVSAFHFNTVAQYGLLANLLSVPVMGSVVMPAAVLAGCLMVLGLEDLAFWVMGQGIGWILGVASWVASLDGSVWRVPAAPGAVLAAILAGGVFAIIWRGPGRAMGFAAMACAIWVWAGAERPDILISDDGRLVGVAGAEGRWLNRAKGSGFAARVWLENDGDRADQAAAAARAPPGDGQLWDLGPHRVALIQAKEPASAELSALCARADLVLTPRSEFPVPCAAITALDLRRAGSHTVHLRAQKLGVTSAKAVAGDRLWNRAGR